MSVARVVAGAFVLTACALVQTRPALAVGEVATARMKFADGKDAGSISLMEATGGVLMKFDLSGLAPGAHAVHVHESGACEGDFTGAGSIYNPLGAKHGFLHEEGPMAGDLPNIHAGADGKATGEFLSNYLTLNKEAEETLFDADGSSIVIFQKPDDYVTDPDGGGGGRVACGTIQAK